MARLPTASLIRAFCTRSLQVLCLIIHSAPLTSPLTTTYPPLTRLTSLATHIASESPPINRDATGSDDCQSVNPTQTPRDNLSFVGRQPQPQTGAIRLESLVRGRRASGVLTVSLRSSMSPSFSGPRLPLSPASPPDSGLKHEIAIQPPAVAPQTPPSPAHSGMSVATKRYVSSYENNRHTDEMADRSTPEMYSRPHSNMTPNTSQPPNSLKRHLTQDEEENLSNKRQKKVGDEHGIATELDRSFTATNHDRDSTDNGTASNENISQQGSAMLGIEQTNLGSTEKAFLVGSSSKAFLPPYPTRKTFELTLTLFSSSQSFPRRCQSPSARYLWSTSTTSKCRANRAITPI